VVEKVRGGQAGEADWPIVRDRYIRDTATAIQCCQFIEAARGQKVPTDVYCTVAELLRHRFLQSLSGRRSTGVSQELMDVPTLDNEEAE
jgi:hypothetical protein